MAARAGPDLGEGRAARGCTQPGDRRACAPRSHARAQGRDRVVVLPGGVRRALREELREGDRVAPVGGPGGPVHPLAPRARARGRRQRRTGPRDVDPGAGGERPLAPERVRAADGDAEGEVNSVTSLAHSDSPGAFELAWLPCGALSFCKI